MAAVIAVSVFNPFRMLMPKLPLDMGNLVVSGTKITMESPHLSGYSADRRPYEIWAKTATQDVTDPDHVELKTLRAKLLTEDQSTVILDARTGLFDNKAQTLDLHKDIFLQTSTGYEARLSQAFVDMGEEYGDVGRTCRRQIDQRNAQRRPLEGLRRRRSRAVRRQCGDEPGQPQQRRPRSTRRSTGCAGRASAAGEAAVRFQILELEMISMPISSPRATHGPTHRTGAHARSPSRSRRSRPAMPPRRAL